MPFDDSANKKSEDGKDLQEEIVGGGFVPWGFCPILFTRPPSKTWGWSPCHWLGLWSDSGSWVYQPGVAEYCCSGSGDDTFQMDIVDV